MIRATLRVWAAYALGYVLAIALLLLLGVVACDAITAPRSDRLGDSQPATVAPYVPAPAPADTPAPAIPRVTDPPYVGPDVTPDCGDADPADPEIDPESDCIP